MKILLYTYSPVLGGMLRHVSALACRLRQKGHDVLVAGKPPREAVTGEPGTLPFQPVAVEGKFDLPGLRRFRALLKKERPDVVHFHLGNVFESLPPLFLALFMGCPVIVTEHYLPFPIARPRRLALLAKRLAVKRIGKVILLGKVFVEPYRRLLKIDAARIAVIPPFSENMAVGGLGGDPLTIGFAGSFSPAKGVDVLLRLAPRLIGLNYRIIFCGCGELAGEIDRLQRDFPGEIEKRFYAGDMAPFYRDIGVLLFLSRSEGLPLAVAEAISAGVPVISTKVGALEEYLGEGEGVLYLPSGREDLVLAALQKLTDNNFRSQLIRRGKKAFADRLDPAVLCMRIEELYRETPS